MAGVGSMVIGDSEILLSDLRIPAKIKRLRNYSTFAEIGSDGDVAIFIVSTCKTSQHDCGIRSNTVLPPSLKCPTLLEK